MKNPQTLAEKLYQQFPTIKLRMIKEYACCAFTLLWVLGKDKIDDGEAILLVCELIDNGCLDSDCTVYWDKVSRYVAHASCSVENKVINSIGKIRERTPVRYMYTDANGKKHGHWVGVEKGRIAFNSLEYSNCVAKGKPVECRVLTFKEI